MTPNKNQKQKPAKVTIHIDPDLKLRAKHAALNEQTTLGRLIERGLENYLQTKKEK